MLTTEKLKEYGVADDKHEAILKDFDTYKTGITETHKTDKADAQSTMMNGQDKVIFEATGIEKLPNEWTSKYAVRAGGLSKQKEFDTYKNDTTLKIEGLDKQISEGFSGADEKLKEQNNSLITTIDSERESWKVKETEFNAKYDNYVADQALLSEMPAFKSDINPEIADILKEKVLKEIKEKYDIKTDKDRDTILVTKEGVEFSQQKLKEFYSERLKDYIEVKRIQNGTGSSGAGAGTGDGGSLSIIDTDTPHIVMSKIRDSLVKEGIDINSEEGQKEYRKRYDKYVLKK